LATALGPAGGWELVGDVGGAVGEVGGSDGGVDASEPLVGDGVEAPSLGTPLLQAVVIRAPPSSKMPPPRRSVFDIVGLLASLIAIRETPPSR
jgi:hypothetical protein